MIYEIQVVKVKRTNKRAHKKNKNKNNWSQISWFAKTRKSCIRNYKNGKEHAVHAKYAGCKFINGL